MIPPGTIKTFTRMGIKYVKAGPGYRGQEVVPEYFRKHVTEVQKPVAPLTPRTDNVVKITKAPIVVPINNTKMPIPLVAAGIATKVGTFIAGGGIQKVTGFIRGVFGRKKKSGAGPVAVAAAAKPSPLPVASSSIVYGDTPGAGKKSVGTWIKDNTALAIGIGVVVLLLFGKQIKKIFS